MSGLGERMVNLSERQEALREKSKQRAHEKLSRAQKRRHQSSRRMEVRVKFAPDEYWHLRDFLKMKRFENHRKLRTFIRDLVAEAIRGEDPVGALHHLIGKAIDVKACDPVNLRDSALDFIDRMVLGPEAETAIPAEAYEPTPPKRRWVPPDYERDPVTGRFLPMEEKKAQEPEIFAIPPIPVGLPPLPGSVPVAQASGPVSVAGLAPEWREDPEAVHAFRSKYSRDPHPWEYELFKKGRI